MRKTLLTATALLLTVAQASMAQGLKMGPRYEKQRIEMAKRNAEGNDRQSTARKAPAVDRWTNVKGNIRLRYVFGYNTDMQRTSETIYVSTREDNSSAWGEEKLLTVGSYKYEHDTQGRMKKKTVTYSEHEGVWADGIPYVQYVHFDTYYIEVSYGSDGLMTYDRYEQENGEGEFKRTLQWQNNADGTKVTETTFDYYGDIEERTTYTPEGHIAAQEDGYDIRELQGTLNDSTITKTRKDGTYDNEGCHYRYDANTGRLLEYAVMRYGEWYTRHLFTYDALGRLVKYEVQDYNSGDDDEENPVPDVGGVVARRTAGTGEGEWKTTRTETYTYANDEVYPMSSPWRAVFGMEGPLASYVTVDEDVVVPDGMGNYGPQKNTITYSRDADGKLTAVTYDIHSEWDGTEGTEETYTATVDANGHIVGTEYYYHEHWSLAADNGTAYSDGKGKRTTQYTWNGESVTRSDTDYEHHSEDYRPSDPYEPYSYYHKSRTAYAYTATGYTATTYSGGSYKSIADCVLESDPESVVSEEQDGTAWKLNTRKSWDESLTTIRKIQDRDLSFRRPSIVNSYDGFAPDTVIVASVKGRVAVARYNDCNDYEYGMPEYSDELSGIESFAYANLCDKWLDVNDENGLTVCRDVEGQPKYILDGTRLLKEYIYYVSYLSTPAYPDYDVYGARRAAADGVVQSYDELTYTYNDAGLLTSITTVSVSEEGERTQEVTTEYIYNASTAIDGAQQATHRTLALKGRTLSTDEGTLSVFNAAGQLVATGAATITLPSAGLYIVKWAGGVKKIAVR